MVDPNQTGKLYVAATPLGNLGDATERLLEALKEADAWVVEDSRRTAKLRDELNVPERDMITYYDEVEQRKLDPIMNRLRRGQTLTIVTDAGTPAIQDPGQLLVDRCHEADIPVRPVPGPSASTAALSVSGFPAEPYMFGGYFPRKQAARREFLLRIKHFPGAVVYFESPNRIRDSLQVVRSYLGERSLMAGREMTKQHQEYLRGTADEVLEQLSEDPKGEFTVVLEPGPDDRVDPEVYLQELLDRGVQLKEAARAAAFFSDQSKSDLYQRGLEYQED